MGLFSIRASVLAGVTMFLSPCPGYAQPAGNSATAAEVPADLPPQDVVESEPAPDPAPAAAEETEEASAAPEAFGGIEEIIVTSQKRAESLQDVPLSVTALSMDQLAVANIQGQVDLPKLTPNLNFTSNSGFASAYIRGVGTQFGNPGLEPSVSVYMDDTYIPRAGSAFFSFADIKRIEVLKGPQGTLYGRNATGGAIRIITNDPVDHFEGKAQLTAGSHGTQIYSGVLNTPITDGVAIRFSAQHEQNDGYVDNLNPGGDADGHTKGQNRNAEIYTLKLVADRDGPFKFTLTGDYSRKDDRESVTEANLFPGAPEQLGAALGGCVSDGFYTYCNDGHSYLHTKAYGTTARLDYDTGPVTLSSITAIRKENERNCADIDGTGAFVQPVCGKPATKQTTQEFQITSNGDGPLRYVGGIYYLREESGYAFTVRAPSFPPGFGLQSSGDNVVVNSIAPYTQIDYDINTEWSLSLGARYTQENKKLRESSGFIAEIDPDTGFPLDGGTSIPSPPCAGPGSPPPCVDAGKTADFNEFTYKGTVSYKPIARTMFYGTVSRGFKSGGFNLPAFGFVDVVKPETLTNYELGWKSTFGVIRWNGALFYYDYKNLQVLITDQSSGGTRAENAGRSKPKGAETDVTWLVAENLELGVGGSYLDATYNDFSGDAYVPCSEAPTNAGCVSQGGLGLALLEDQDLSGKELVNAPKWTYYLRAQYTLETGNAGIFTLSGGANYRSEAYFDSANRFEDVERTMYSAKLNWASPSERYFASVYGENLGDKKYNLIKSPQATGGWRVPAPPRWLYASVGMNF